MLNDGSEDTKVLNTESLNNNSTIIDANDIDQNRNNTSYWSYFNSIKISGYVPYLNNNNNADNSNTSISNDTHSEPLQKVNIHDELKKKLQSLTPADQLFKFFDLLTNKKIIMLASFYTEDSEELETIISFLELVNMLTRFNSIDISILDLNFIKLHYTKLIDLQFTQDDFKDEYQPVLLELLNKDLTKLDAYNKKQLTKQYTLFQSDNNESLNNSPKFSKNQTYQNDEEAVDTFENNNNQQQPENENNNNSSYTSFYKLLTSHPIISTIQGTINNAYTKDHSITNNNNTSLQNSNLDKIAIQIYEEKTGQTKLLLENSISWHLNGIECQKEYTPLSDYQVYFDKEETSANSHKTHIQIDDSVFLPSSNIQKYFHKRTIWSKIGLRLREHYKLDNGDLHLYLHPSYNLSLKEKKHSHNNGTSQSNEFLRGQKKNIEPKIEEINNLIIGFHIVDVGNYGNGDLKITDLNSKKIVKTCSQQIENLLKEQHTLQNDENIKQKISNRQITIEIPAITNDSIFLDNLLERLQQVFIQLVKLNKFDGIENLFFTTNGESFNLLILLLPYLKNILNLKASKKEFSYSKYPINQSFSSNSTDIKLKKIGILGIDINPKISTIYAFNESDLFFKDFFNESLNWCLQNNIKISLVSNLYDCKQFALEDKLLLGFLHPNIIRGIFVQDKILNFDSTNFDTIPEEQCLNRISRDRYFEIRLISLLLTCLNSGYLLDDTIPLLSLVSTIFQSRAFNKLTITSQLKKKWDKMNKDFISKMEQTHLDWKNMDPKFIFENLNNDKQKFEFLNYWMIKKDLFLLDADIILTSKFDVSKISIFDDLKKFDFFISNTLFTTDVQVNKDMLIYDYKNIENALLNDEERQFMLIWKLRDFVTNFLNVRNLPSSLLNLFDNNDEMRVKFCDGTEEEKEIHIDDVETIYIKNNDVPIQLLSELFDLYLVYIPPANNKNLSRFKSEILDMIWDNYETSFDFLEDIST